MTALLYSAARLFAAAVGPATSYRARVALAVALVGVFFGLWRLAFAGLVDGVFPLSSSGEAPRLMVSEFGLTQDTLWSIPAENPERREPIATVPHAPGYGILAALSPDGRSLAYTALPPGLKSPSADSPAELWFLDLSTGEARVLAADADLLVTPVWASDGHSVVFRRSYPLPEVEDGPGAFELVSVALEGGETLLAKADAALFPVGFDADGALLYTRVSPSGTDLARVEPSAPAETLTHLSDDFTRDWRLSPDGLQIAYLAPRPTAGGIALRVMVASLSSGPNEASARIQAAGLEPADEFGPAWHPDGNLTLGRLSPGQFQAAAVRLESDGAKTLTQPDRGFDVPIAWSPDGRLLVVRTFEGFSPLEPGGAHLELVKEDGGRLTINMPGEIAVVGWLPTEATREGEGYD